MDGNVPKNSGKNSSMIWGIVMLICGIAAIALPWASGIGVVIVVGWVLIFAAVSHLVFAFHTHGVGGFLWQLLLALVYGAAGVFILMKSARGSGNAHAGARGFPFHRSCDRDRALFPGPAQRECRLDFVRCDRDVDPRDSDLGAMAKQRTLVYRDDRRHQPDLQWHLALEPCRSNAAARVVRAGLAC
jgi:hypothetical protein